MAVERSRGPLPGPVHLNIPFQKPLAPSPEDEPPNWSDFDQSPVPVVHHGSCEPDAGAIAMLADAIRRADRGIIVTGPCDPRSDLSSLEYLATEAGLPLLADPLSGVRFSGGSTDSPVIGGYDSYVATCPTPDLIIRAGARPVSEPLQRYLANHDGDHIVIDPCADYRDPRFSTTDIVAADPPSLVAKIVEAIDGDEIPSSLWEPFHRAEKRYWSLVEDDRSVLPPEGRVAYQTLQEAPPNASVYVSNSMPIRDVDRFGRPRDGPVTVLGNRGASGIDGIISAGIGGGVETDQSVILTGDLALYHDMNGLLAIDRTGIQPTIVVINNDGGGIFHKLPIEAIDPPFTELFKTPHGLDFKHAARMYGLEYHCTDVGGFGKRYRKALESPPALVEVSIDAERNHQHREDFKDTVTEVVSEGFDTA